MRIFHQYSILLLLPWTNPCYSWIASPLTTKRMTANTQYAEPVESNNNNNEVRDPTRRAWVRTTVLSSTSILLPLLVTPQFSPIMTTRNLAHAAETTDTAATKILVLGGTGFVGSRIVAQLNELNIATVATSRDGRDNTIAFDISAPNVQDQVKELAQGCSAVISCVGVIGTPNDQAVNAGTGYAAAGAKAAGVARFVYITVAPEVKEFAKDIDFLQGYMQGKTFSRNAVLEYFPDTASVLIEPTFIYGGGSFELNPPRVAEFYGKFIEGILSSSPLRSLDRVLSPGFLKIALEPPVPVEAVVRAAIAGALGKTPPILDTYDAIKQAATLL